MGDSSLLGAVFFRSGVLYISGFAAADGFLGKFHVAGVEADVGTVTFSDAGGVFVSGIRVDVSNTGFDDSGDRFRIDKRGKIAETASLCGDGDFDCSRDTDPAGCGESADARGPVVAAF